MTEIFSSKDFFIFALLYFTSVSLLAVVITVYDKLASIKHKRRISEKALLSVGALGGAVCMLLTMNIIRHKTRHIKFMLGLPLIIALQVLIIGFMLYRCLI